MRLFKAIRDKFLGPLLGYGIIAGTLLAVVSILALIGGAVMRVLGFTYRSIGSFLLFFLLFLLLDLPFDLAAGALPKALCSMGRLSALQARVLHFVLDLLFSVLAMRAADALMASVSATPLSILAVSLLFALPDLFEKGKADDGIDA